MLFQLCARDPDGDEPFRPVGCFIRTDGAVAADYLLFVEDFIQTIRLYARADIEARAMETSQFKVDLSPVREAADQIVKSLLCDRPALESLEGVTERLLNVILGEPDRGGLNISIAPGSAAPVAGDHVIRLRVTGVDECCAAARIALESDLVVAHAAPLVLVAF